MSQTSDSKVSEQSLPGSTLSNFFHLMWQNKFNISWKYLPRALFAFFIVLLTTPLRIIDSLVYLVKINKRKISKDPVFIIGHWRSGTTYLHMLFAQDKQFGFASNLHAFMPHVFLSGEGIFRRSIRNVMPKTRRMDNFPLKVDYPSEEEFAIANTTPYSFYNGLPFPKNRKYYAKFITFKNKPKQSKKWKRAYKRFIKKVSYKFDGKQLVLKNPPNTGRLKILLDLFPNAKFVHIYRNPYKVFPSTKKMYEKMFPYFFLQKAKVVPTDFILNVYREMYQEYLKQKEFIPEENLVEISYESFLEDPLATMKHIYDSLNVAGFSEAKAAMKAYIDDQKSYKPNKHQLSAEMIQKINNQWGFMIEAFGYKKRTP
ncbi:MAG: sulfotransferase [Asgard group archaeon]|nr:sulfotransferase [Asgard group archaeon]